MGMAGESCLSWTSLAETVFAKPGYLSDRVITLRPKNLRSSPRLTKIPSFVRWNACHLSVIDITSIQLMPLSLALTSGSMPSISSTRMSSPMCVPALSLCLLAIYLCLSSFSTSKPFGTSWISRRPRSASLRQRVAPSSNPGECTFSPFDDHDLAAFTLHLT